jgi:uncharacterized protein (DUF169 family)
LSFRRYFQLKYSPVGVKILTEYVESGEEELRFCEAVKIAAGGRRMIISDNLSCAGAELSLGFVEPLKEKETQAVLLEPFSEMESYDVVLVIATPEKIMNVSRVYSQVFGEKMTASFSGERAVCGEATAFPVKTGKPNLSFLCEGARIYAGYGDEEVVAGFPEDIFRKMSEAIVRGKVKALCGCLMDDLPEHVKRKLENMGFDKATDHFTGFFNGKVVKLYIFKNKIANRIGVFTSVKFKGEEEAESAISNFNGDFSVLKRENWVELSKIIQLSDDISRAVRNPEFDKVLRMELEKIVSAAKKLKKS